MRKKAEAEYVEISAEDMDRYVKRAFHAFRPKRGQFRGIYFYDLHLSKSVAIRIWSSIRVHAGSGKDVGEGSIKLRLLSRKDEKNLENEKEAYVKRVRGWRDNLADRVETLVEKYDNRAEWWDNWAETRGRSGDAEQAYKKYQDQERAEDEDGEGDSEREEQRPPTPPPPPPPPPQTSRTLATWAKLKDGSWGVSTTDPDAREGDTVKVQRQNGAISPATLGRMVWQGYGKKLFTVERQERRYAHSWDGLAFDDDLVGDDEPGGDLEWGP